VKRAGITFFVLIFFLTIFIKIISLIGPVDSSNDYVVAFNIEPGTSSNIIGERLYEKELINSPLIFKIVVGLLGYDNKLQAGYYELKPSENTFNLINSIANGRIATIKITIPEGFTVEEISDRLAENTFYTQEMFINECKNAHFTREFLDDSNKNTRYFLEGFLYPDTYIIPKEYTAHQIIELMLDQFEKRWWKRLKEETCDSLYTPFELITIASLIEEEGKLDEEKPLISAVIYNRLQRGMLLQIDAGIQYALAERKSRILYKDLNLDSPYNTYRFPGLPPGPICNPGDDAIEAAFNPANVDYLFYFALKDGSHIFTNTYYKHLKLQDQMKKEGLINE
jgi:UPF0755 protein